MIGEAEHYNLLTFKLCHLNGEGKEERIDSWRDDGLIDVFDAKNTEGDGGNNIIKKSCISLNTQFMPFGTKANGETTGFILGIKLLEKGPVAITISVNIQTFNFWKLLVRLFLILLVCFTLTLGFGFGYLVHKWRRRRLGMVE